MYSTSNKKIQIYVYRPSKYAIKISVPPTKRLGDLFNHIPSKNLFYVYKGRVLSNDQTLTNLGIRDGDSIVLFFKKNCRRTNFFQFNHNKNLNSFDINNKYICKGNKCFEFDEGEDDDEIQKWIQCTKDTMAFNESLKMIINKDNAHESARIKDLRFAKLELKKRCFRNLCYDYSRSENQHKSNENMQNSSLIIDYSVNNEPSTEPLPIFFSQ